MDPHDSLTYLKTLQEQYKSNSRRLSAQDMQAKLQEGRLKLDERLENVLEQELMQELQRKFKAAMNKLRILDTREVGERELHKLIHRNCSIEALLIYMKCLHEHPQSHSSQGREKEVALIGFLAETYKDTLIAANTNPLQLVIRLSELIQEYFTDSTVKVREAAAEALCKVYEFSIPKDSLQTSLTFMLDPLNKLLTSGKNYLARQAAALSLLKWTECVLLQGESTLVEVIFQRTVTLMIKLRPEYHDLISTIGLSMDQGECRLAEDRLIALLSKLTQCLKSTNFNAASLKLESCKFLCFAIRSVAGFRTEDLKPLALELVEALKEARTHKSPEVQNAAREALKYWDLHLLILTRKEQGDSGTDLEELESTQITQIHEQTGKINWGSGKQTFLKRGTGHAQVETSGRLDLSKVNESRQSILEYIKQQKLPDLPKKDIEIFYGKGLLYRRETISTEVQCEPCFLNPDLQISTVDFGVFSSPKPKLRLKTVGSISIIPKRPKPKRLLLTRGPSLGTKSLELLEHASNLEKRSKVSASAQTDTLSEDILGSFVSQFQNQLTQDLSYKLAFVEEKLKCVEDSVSELQESQDTYSISSVAHSNKATQTRKRSKAKDQLTQRWLEALKLVQRQRLDEAYSFLLDTGDDLYLLRMLHKTGPCLGALTAPTRSAVLAKLMGLGSSHFVEAIMLAWVEELALGNSFGSLHESVQAAIHQQLYHLAFGQSEFSSRAWSLLGCLSVRGPSNLMG